uniref:Uncharacterized protein n=1 Tax=Anopheles culicifacies TaxID=139723 RepID=A0A182LVH4_9DIPT
MKLFLVRCIDWWVWVVFVQVEPDENKPFDNASIQSGDSVDRPLEMDDGEVKNDNEEIDDEVDDNDDDADDDDDDDEIDDELLEDDDDEEGDHVRLDGTDAQDVDEEFTSDSFCSGEFFSSNI